MLQCLCVWLFSGPWGGEYDLSVNARHLVRAVDNDPQIMEKLKAQGISDPEWFLKEILITQASGTQKGARNGVYGFTVLSAYLFVSYLIVLMGKRRDRMTDANNDK